MGAERRSTTERGRVRLSERLGQSFGNHDSEKSITRTNVRIAFIACFRPTHSIFPTRGVLQIYSSLQLLALIRCRLKQI